MFDVIVLLDQESKTKTNAAQTVAQTSGRGRRRRGGGSDTPTNNYTLLSLSHGDLFETELK
jgi:hypothetical protein